MIATEANALGRIGSRMIPSQETCLNLFATSFGGKERYKALEKGIIEDLRIPDIRYLT